MPALSNRQDPYRDRLKVDRIVETTHAVDCGGGCTFQVGVRDGRISYERPADSGTLPGKRVRACAAGFCAASIVADPGRVLRPLVRGPLLDAWERARSSFEDPLKAWEMVIASGLSWRDARGRGGFRESSWETALLIVAAAAVREVGNRGPSSIGGIGSGGSHALVASASGRRFLSLLGGTFREACAARGRPCPAAEELWGDGVDVCETAAWKESRLIVVMGFDPNSTMSPDAPLLSEARLDGTKVWILDDVLSAAAAHGDRVLPIAPSGLAPFWMAVTRGVLSALAENRCSLLTDYLKSFTEAPLLALLEPDGNQYKPGPLLTSARLPTREGAPERAHGHLLWNRLTGSIEPAPGSTGYRGQQSAIGWNLRSIHPESGAAQEPILSFLGNGETAPVRFSDHLSGGSFVRSVPCSRFRTAEGEELLITTVLDLLYGEFCVDRGLPGEDERVTVEPVPCSPAWAEQAVGIGRRQIEEFIEGWISVIREGEGRCLVISGWEATLGASAEAAFFAAGRALILSGAPGRPGGGLACYSGQRKIHLSDSWKLLTSGLDWSGEIPAIPVNAPERTGEERILFVWDSDPLGDSGIGGGVAPAQEEGQQPGSAAPTPPELLVNLNFRIDETALRSDIILPAATWYEKADLNCAETIHRIHAVTPVLQAAGESLSEWEIFGRLADAISGLTPVPEDRAPGFPLETDDRAAPAVSQTSATEPRFERLVRLAGRFQSLGPYLPGMTEPASGPAAAEDEATGAAAGGQTRQTALRGSEEVCAALLRLSAAGNGSLGNQRLSELARTTGIPPEELPHLSSSARIEWDELRQRPVPPLFSLLWSGEAKPGAYVPFSLNLRHRIPWNTPTGRQRLWLPSFVTPRAVAEPRVKVLDAPADSANREANGLELELRPRFRKWDFHDLFESFDALQNWFRPGPLLWIHPDDAAILAPGDSVQVEAISGSCRMAFRLAESRAVPRGCGLVHPRYYLQFRNREGT